MAGSRGRRDRSARGRGPRRSALGCLAAALALSLVASGFAQGPAAAPPTRPPTQPLAPVSRLYGPVPLVNVIDGDTIVVLSNVGPRIVRLIGIDAPETSSGDPNARAATEHLVRLLGDGEPLWLELDLELEDVYGRLLAYVYAPDAGGAWRAGSVRATQVNLAMAEAGWARPLTIAPNVTYADLYQAAAEAAQAEEQGMWALAALEGAGDEAASAPAASGAPDDAPIRLHCGLLNPAAPNDVGEWVSVFLREPFDTRGYYLFDEGSRSVFRLPAGVQPAGELRVDNPGQGVWNNSGDVVYLMLGGEVVDRWEYQRHEAVEGRVVCRGG